MQQPAADATLQSDYVSDTVYTSRYHPAQNPLHVNYVAALNGFSPVALDEPFTYLDLGCGTGVNVNLLAAMFPRGRFYGLDLNAEHIARARRQADAGGVPNAFFQAGDFSDLATLDLEPMDFIGMYGAFTWISEALRRTVLDGVARLLAPGGRFLVHYAALPGKAQPAAMWHLVREITREAPGGSIARVEKGIAVLRQMREGQAAFFQQNPLAAARELAIAGQDVEYLAHEMLNEHTGPIYHAPLARDLRGRGLAFAGNANLLLEHVHLGMPARFRALVESQPDRIAQETLKDFIINNGIRLDVYVKGPPASRPLDLLSDMVFGELGLSSGAELPAVLQLKAATPAVSGVRAALAEHALRLSDLIARPELREYSAEQVVAAVQVLLAAGVAWPFMEPVSLDSVAGGGTRALQPATPFVRTLIAGAGSRAAVALPSRRWGNAYTMPWPRAACLKAWLDAGPDAGDESVWRAVQDRGVDEVGGEATPPPEDMQAVRAELQRLRTHVLPRLRALGILE